MDLGVDLDGYRKSRQPSLVRIPDRPASSIVGTPTTLSRSPFTSVLIDYQSPKIGVMHTFIVNSFRVVQV
jgi:hypothetical protein